MLEQTRVNLTLLSNSSIFDIQESEKLAYFNFISVIITNILI